MADATDRIDEAIRLHGEALEALDEGDLTRARACGAAALTLFEEESGDSHPDVANVLNCLARIDEHAARYDDAERQARRSAEIMRRVRQQAS